MNSGANTEIDQLAAMFYTAMRFLSSGIEYEVFNERGEMKLVPLIQCNEIMDTPENRKLADEFAADMENGDLIELLHIASYRVHDLLVRAHVQQPMKVVAALRSYLLLRTVVVFSDETNPIPITDPVSPVHDLFYDLVTALGAIEPLTVEWIEYDMSSAFDHEFYAQNAIERLHGVEIDMINMVGGYIRRIQ